MLAVLVAAAWSALCTTVIAAAVARALPGGLRAAADDEVRGLDVSELDELVCAAAAIEATNDSCDVDERDDGTGRSACGAGDSAVARWDDDAGGKCAPAPLASVTLQSTTSLSPSTLSAKQVYEDDC